MIQLLSISHVIDVPALINRANAVQNKNDESMMLKRMFTAKRSLTLVGFAQSEIRQKDKDMAVSLKNEYSLKYFVADDECLYIHVAAQIPLI